MLTYAHRRVAEIARAVRLFFGFTLKDDGEIAVYARARINLADAELIRAKEMTYTS